VGVSNFRDELEEVWVPKDAGELKDLLLTIQNEPGRKILKHKIQQALREKRYDNWSDDGDDDTGGYASEPPWPNDGDYDDGDDDTGGNAMPMRV